MILRGLTRERGRGGRHVVMVKVEVMVMVMVVKGIEGQWGEEERKGGS